MSKPAAGGDELAAEVMWKNGLPAFFPPFACSAAAGTTGRTAHEVVKRGGHASSSSAMRDLLVVQDDVEPVPWLHCSVVDGDGCDDVTAPLPPEYCSGLLSELAAAGRSAGGAPSTSHGGVGVPPPPPAEIAVLKQPGRPTGEAIMNFTFFSRPLQRPPGGERETTSSNPVEPTVVLQTATNRLRSTPLFSEQRTAWLQPPKESRTTVAAPPPPPAPPIPIPQPPPPPPATTSSVCSDNGDRIRLKRSSRHYHQPPEWSVSQDEDLDDDDEPGALRRSTGRRSTKRGRTAEVHNMSERRRRDRINEKMRALQELIPNCNKIDKASMLEEAIEYLKTLQLQVQMMSMGTPGLCLPPMLMPSPMAHFHHHLGAMAAGFGMGAAAAQFPCTMMSPGAAMFGMPVLSPPPPFPSYMANIVNNNAAGEQAPPSDPPP